MPTTLPISYSPRSSSLTQENNLFIVRIDKREARRYWKKEEHFANDSDVREERGWGRINPIFLAM